ncbi:adenosine deaminase [Paenibacillus protaetiae]|uniref:adenosine deaminase n=1 Tax=Paenibacillus protaetiae TaxID=2509456 RepID=A0A4P6ES61_9BACL|nr:adenosine deaminase [Paenibacillus protaetiae]QAY65724.1 adenosine deaminase [Paenibacillus protaetiae]
MTEWNEQLLKALPKIDLHVHLDGSVKPETLRELADAQGMPLPEGELTGSMQVDEQCESLVDYLSKFSFVLPFLQTAEALERVAYEVVEQAKEQNCLYIEVRFAPLLHTQQGLSAAEAIRLVVAGLQRAEAELGVPARAIAICMRHDTPERSKEVIQAAAEWHGKGVAAVDLAGDEAGYPPELHRELFELARRLKLPVTIHAGEAGGADNVRTAIEQLGALRIGHGVRMQEDPSVVELVQRRRIPLEMCPLSNIQTKAVSGWEVYPIRSYMQQGILVTVNTDNMTVSGTTMTNEYALLAEKLGFSGKELAQLSLNAADAAFLEEPAKSALKRQMMQKLAELGLEPAEI